MSGVGVVAFLFSRVGCALLMLGGGFRGGAEGGGVDAESGRAWCVFWSAPVDDLPRRPSKTFAHINIIIISLSLDNAAAALQFFHFAML